MAKAKKDAGIQNKIIYARASYLYQAANYLASRANDADLNTAPAGTQGEPAGGSGSGSGSSSSSSRRRSPANEATQRRTLHSLARQAVRDMRAVSLKAQIRQGAALKRTVCRFCDTLQVEGQTCRSVVHNASRGGRKPWADVLVIRCGTCGNVKRYPVCAPRQPRCALRPLQPSPGETAAAAGSAPGT